MHLRNATPRFGLMLVSALAAVSILASGADAGNGHGQKKNRKHRGYSQGVRYAPAYAAHRPRYVSYRSPRVAVVRPAPYVRVGARIGAVDIGAIFGPRRQYSNYEYGCNFCEARFASFNTYDSHVRSCDYRPRDVQIQARVWDEGGYREWCDNDRVYARGGYDDGYDDRYDDDRYAEDWR